MADLAWEGLDLDDRAEPEDAEHSIQGRLNSEGFSARNQFGKTTVTPLLVEQILQQSHDIERRTGKPQGLAVQESPKGGGRIVDPASIPDLQFPPDPLQGPIGLIMIHTGKEHRKGGQGWPDGTLDPVS